MFSAPFYTGAVLLITLTIANGDTLDKSNASSRLIDDCFSQVGSQLIGVIKHLQSDQVNIVNLTVSKRLYSVLVAKQYAKDILPWTDPRSFHFVVGFDSTLNAGRRSFELHLNESRKRCNKTELNDSILKSLRSLVAANANDAKCEVCHLNIKPYKYIVLKNPTWTLGGGMSGGVIKDISSNSLKCCKITGNIATEITCEDEKDYDKTVKKFRDTISSIYMPTFSAFLYIALVIYINCKLLERYNTMKSDYFLLTESRMSMSCSFLHFFDRQRTKNVVRFHTSVLACISLVLLLVHLNGPYFIAIIGVFCALAFVFSPMCYNNGILAVPCLWIIGLGIYILLIGLLKTVMGMLYNILHYLPHITFFSVFVYYSWNIWNAWELQQYTLQMQIYKELECNKLQIEDIGDGTQNEVVLVLSKKLYKKIEDKLLPFKKNIFLVLSKICILLLFMLIIYCAIFNFSDDELINEQRLLTSMGAVALSYFLNEFIANRQPSKAWRKQIRKNVETMVKKLRTSDKELLKTVFLTPKLLVDEKHDETRLDVAGGHDNPHLDVAGGPDDPHLDVAGGPDDPHLDVAERHDDPHLDVAEGPDDPHLDVAEGPDDPHLDVAEGPDDPHLDVAERHDDPHLDVAEGPDDPHLDVAEGADDPHLDVAEGPDDPHLDVAEGPDDPHLDVAERHDDPHLDVAERHDDPHLDVAEGPDDPHLDVAEGPDDPHLDVAEGPDDPHLDVAEGPDDPHLDVAEGPDDPHLDVAEGPDDPHLDVAERHDDPYLDVAEGPDDPHLDVAEGPDDPHLDVAGGYDDLYLDVAEGHDEPQSAVIEIYENPLSLVVEDDQVNVNFGLQEIHYSVATAKR